MKIYIYIYTPEYIHVYMYIYIRTHTGGEVRWRGIWMGMNGFPLLKMMANR